MAKRDLVKLLVRLYGDPKLAERMKKNPKAVMKAAKLSAADQEILSSGDEANIRGYLGKEAAKSIIVQAPSIIVQSPSIIVQSATKKKS